MNNYRVMIVDDEEEVAQAIVRKIDWNSLGFAVPQYARNGLDALSEAEELQPDVVMTDIKMPYMDGLELSRRLKEQYPNVRIIIFSGFDEFEYAKEAIRLQAEEYILKPVSAEELTKVFIRIRSSLDSELDAKQNVQKLQTYYMESLPMLQENFLASLIEGKVPERDIVRFIKDYQLDLHGPYYCVTVLHTSTHHMPEGVSPALLTVSVYRLGQERFNAKWNARFFSYLGNTVVLAQLEQTDQIKSFTDECDVFCRLARSVCNAIVTAGVGQVCDSLDDLQSSYAGARSAVSYRLLYGTGRAINISEIAPQESGASFETDSEELHDVFKAIRMHDADSVTAAVSQYLSGSTANLKSIQEYRFFVMELVSELYRFARSNQLDQEEVFQEHDDILQTVQRMEKDDLQKWLSDICIRMQEMIQKKRLDTTKSFVTKAMEYVDEHYGDVDLNVDSICTTLGVSSAYFSTVFKKETGKTFINYLTELRMNKAVHLLNEKDEKTYIIAQQVGYSDPNYFSYVFKKQFGVSPSKYKTGK